MSVPDIKNLGLYMYIVYVLHWLNNILNPILVRTKITKSKEYFRIVWNDVSLRNLNWKNNEWLILLFSKQNQTLQRLISKGTFVTI